MAYFKPNVARRRQRRHLAACRGETLLTPPWYVWLMLLKTQCHLAHLVYSGDQVLSCWYWSGCKIEEAPMLCTLFRGHLFGVNWSPVWCESHLLGLWHFDPWLTCGRDAVRHLALSTQAKAPGRKYEGNEEHGSWLFLHDILIFKWHSDDIQTTYYCIIYFEGMTVACIQSPTYIQPMMVFAFSLHSIHTGWKSSIACHRQASWKWGEL